MKNLCLIVLGLSFAALSVSAHESIDLSGTWKFDITKSENKECIGTHGLMFVPSMFKSQSGEILYLVDGSICNDKIWGASIETVSNQRHLVWYMLKGQEFDAESNMILRSSAAVLSLGGDFEEYEVATMTKIAEQ